MIMIPIVAGPFPQNRQAKCFPRRAVNPQAQVPSTMVVDAMKQVAVLNMLTGTETGDRFRLG